LYWTPHDRCRAARRGPRWKHVAVACSSCAQQQGVCIVMLLPVLREPPPPFPPPTSVVNMQPDWQQLAVHGSSRLECVSMGVAFDQAQNCLPACPHAAVGLSAVTGPTHRVCRRLRSSHHLVVSRAADVVRQETSSSVLHGSQCWLRIWAGRVKHTPTCWGGCCAATSTLA
jgi:hypothetical protein